MISRNAVFQKLIGNAVSVLTTLYMISVMCMVPYYNWQFAKENGFASWLFLGEMIPTGKALVWPYFVFHTSDEDKQRAAVHALDDVLTVRQDAIALAAQWSDKPSIPDDVLGKMKGYNDEMLEKSRSIDVGALDEVYPQLGTMFSAKFVKSIEAADGAIAKRARGESWDTPEGREQTQIDQEWMAWFHPKGHEIMEAMKAKW